MRLPFSFKDFDVAPRSFVHRSCPLPSDEEVAASVTPPGASVRGPAPRLPNPPPASSYAGDVCNAYLPATSVRERFLWVAEFYARNEFVVLVDNHLREDQTALQDEDTWVASWASLAKDMFSRPALKSAVIFDLLNEPDNFGMKWDKLGPIYLRAMSAIDQSTGGEAVFGIEGTGQSGLNANWGDGFATTKINELGLSDPRPFFDALLKKPYVNRVILAPHVYPPSVTNNGNAATGTALYDRLVRYTLYARPLTRTPRLILARPCPLPFTSHPHSPPRTRPLGPSGQPAIVMDRCVKSFPFSSANLAPSSRSRKIWSLLTTSQRTWRMAMWVGFGGHGTRTAATPVAWSPTIGCVSSGRR